MGAHDAASRRSNAEQVHPELTEPPREWKTTGRRAIASPRRLAAAVLVASNSRTTRCACGIGLQLSDRRGGSLRWQILQSVVHVRICLFGYEGSVRQPWRLASIATWRSRVARAPQLSDQSVGDVILTTQLLQVNWITKKSKLKVL